VTVIIERQGDEIVWRDVAWSRFDIDEAFAPSSISHDRDA
jgi:hypothetical protein